MELAIGIKLFDPRHKNIFTVLRVYRNGSSVPLSRIDTEPTDAYEVEYHVSKAFGSKTFWSTKKEMEEAGIRLATDAEVILYAK